MICHIFLSYAHGSAGYSVSTAAHVTSPGTRNIFPLGHVHTMYVEAARVGLRSTAMLKVVVAPRRDRMESGRTVLVALSVMGPEG